MDSSSELLQRAAEITKLPLETVQRAFGKYKKLSTKEAYIRFVSSRGVVVPGSERYLSYTYCLRETILRQKAEEFDHFLNLKLHPITELIGPKLSEARVFQLLVRYHAEQFPQFYKKIGILANGAKWNQIKVYLSLENSTRTRYFEILPNHDAKGVIMITLGIKYFKQFSYQPGNLSEFIDRVGDIFYLTDKETFINIHLLDDKVKSSLFMTAIEFDDMELLAKINPEDFTRFFKDIGLNLSNDPVNVAKVIIPYFDSVNAREFIHEAIEQHAFGCFDLMKRHRPSLLNEKLLTHAIHASNYPVFMELISDQKLSQRFISEHLSECYAPGIWRYFLEQYPKLKLPLIPETVQFFLDS